MRICLIFLALLLVIAGHAQTEFSMYRLNGNLPQANMINPAFAPNSKVIIGLPVISSIHLSANSDGISFRDLFKSSEGTDSLKLDTLSLFSKLKPSNGIHAREAVQLFYFGLRGKRSYFSFGIHQVMEMRFHYPGDLVGWALRGPGDHHYSGKPLDFGNFYGRSIAYNKASVSYARDITSKLRVGVRFNYLLGVATAETTKVKGTLTMGIDSVSLNTGTMQFQTGGVDFFDQDNLSASDYKNYFLNTKNKGIALDFGATYNLTDNLTLSAAVNDLGHISWKEYTRSYEVAPVNYTFRGFDLLDYLNQSSGEQFLEAELDSLENLFSSTETTGNKFKTSLIGKFYAGANFRILRVNNFSALFYLDMFQKKIKPAISLGYNLQLGRLLNTTVGITYQNGKINNVGAGIALKLTHLQFYATSDRANSFIYPARASRVDAHIGMNLVFGKPKKKNNTADKKEEPEETEPVQEKKDTTFTPQPVIETQPDTAQTRVDTVPTVTEEAVSAAPVVLEPEIKLAQTIEEPIHEEPPQAVETPAVVEEPIVQMEELRHETVKRGNHPDELLMSHYVIVGAFRSKENAKNYSNQLFDEGYANKYGFVTEKNVYYVYVFASSTVEETREVRDRFRKLNAFQFAESWVLSVEQ